MTQYIIKKAVTENFTIVPNDILQDERLSFKATGLLVYLLGLPDHWKIHAKELETRKKDGRESIASGMKELEDAEYLLRVKRHDESGHFVYDIYVRSDLNHPFPPQTGFSNTVAENPYTGNPLTENPQLVSTNSSKNLESKNLLVNTYLTEQDSVGQDKDISANQSLTAEAVEVAKNFYSYCREVGKKPAVRHNQMVELVEDYLERGYSSQELQLMFAEHIERNEPWTMNHISYTEAAKERKHHGNVYANR